jgi:dimethyladenosine transferase (EC 2.1.1.-)
MCVRSRRKRLGQHFLRDVSIAEYIAGLVPGGLDVIEVGPGRGILTIPLAQKSRVVYAIEVDPALADALRRTAPPNVVVIEGDALELEWPKADRLHVVVYGHHGVFPLGPRQLDDLHGVFHIPRGRRGGGHQQEEEVVGGLG